MVHEGYYSMLKSIFVIKESPLPNHNGIEFITALEEAFLISKMLQDARGILSVKLFIHMLVIFYGHFYVLVDWR